MRKFLVVVVILLAISLGTSVEKGNCGDVTQIVFNCVSTARSSLTRPSLRIKVADNLREAKNAVVVQAFPLQSASTYNYYMTKSITFPVTDKMALIEIQTDMDATYKINSETEYLAIQAGVPIIRTIRK